MMYIRSPKSQAKYKHHYEPLLILKIKEQQRKKDYTYWK